jgi:hypothetical protein
VPRRNGNTVWSDDEVFEEEERALFTDRGKEVALPRGSNKCRNKTEYRVAVSVLFHSAHIPSPVVVLPAKTERDNPIEWANPQKTDEAEALMITENFWQSVELKHVVERNRIRSFQPGFSGVGRFRARKDEESEAQACGEIDSKTDVPSLDFYLGTGTRLRL